MKTKDIKQRLACLESAAKYTRKGIININKGLAPEVFDRSKTLKCLGEDLDWTNYMIGLVKRDLGGG